MAPLSLLPTVVSADETAEGGAWPSGGGPGPDYVEYVFVFSVVQLFVPIPVVGGGALAALLLGLRVRRQLGSWMSVSCHCCFCQVEVSATGRSLVQRSPTDCVV